LKCTFDRALVHGVVAKGLAHRFPRLDTPIEGLCSGVEGSWGFSCNEESNLWCVRKTSSSITHMTLISFVEVSEARFLAVSMLFENDLKIRKAWTVRVLILLW
jgi:hypothetical protein